MADSASGKASDGTYKGLREANSTPQTVAFRHGPDCPHCKIRTALMDFITQHEAPPTWDLVVFGLTLALAEFIASNPSSEARLNATVYVRRELPQIVGEEERSYMAHNAKGYEVAAPKGRA